MLGNCPCCKKKFTLDDVAFGYFGDLHLCNECFRDFDDQKMRGRFEAIGIIGDDAAELTGALKEAGAKFEWDLRRPVKELRYTESVAEWISWQNDK